MFFGVNIFKYFVFKNCISGLVNFIQRHSVPSIKFSLKNFIKDPISTIIMTHKFIEVEYTGKLTDGTVFDTTDEKTAKENNLHDPKLSYGPLTICMGEGHLIKGLEEQIRDKGTGSYTIELESEKAFGKRDAKLIQLVPLKKFTEQNIKPFPGLQLNVDNAMATVKTVSGGRCMVDFNHPLAGKDIVYDIKINKEVTDDLEKVKGLLEVEMRAKPKVDLKEDTITIKGIKKEAQELVKKRLSEFVDKKIVFEEDKSS